ncbi:hypothetical protein [Blastococcus sp. SYSU D00695]
MSTDDGAARPRGGAALAPDREGAVAARLRGLGSGLDVEPAPDFRAATRARLVAMAAVRSPEPAPGGLARRLLRARAVDGPPSRWRARLTAGLAGAALAVSALGVVVALAADAQPGDLLYGLKRGTERTQLALAGDDRGLTLLEFAGTRLGELEDEHDDAGLVVATLETMDDQTAEGAALLVTAALDSGTPAALDELAGWTSGQSAALAAVRPRLPAATADAAQASWELLDAVQARVGAARAALGCATRPADAGRDDLGPIPGLCRPALVPSAPTGSTPAAPGGSAPAAPTGGAPAPTEVPPPVAPADPGAGSTPSAVPTGGAGAGPPPRAVPGPPVPLPLPVPAPAGRPALPSPAGPPGATPPPLLDLPLPLCLPPLLC